jgi:hypothetical protein
MLSPTVSDELNPQSIGEQLEAAKQRKAEALARYETASAEVAWLEDGMRLFKPGAAQKRESPRELLADIFPDGPLDQDAKPSLRQAMVIVMQDHPGRQWTVADLVAALDDNGWLPENGTKRVSDMAGEMVRLNQAVREGRGIYKLSPELAAALEGSPGSKE